MGFEEGLTTKRHRGTSVGDDIVLCLDRGGGHRLSKF